MSTVSVSQINSQTVKWSNGYLLYMGKGERNEGNKDKRKA